MPKNCGKATEINKGDVVLIEGENLRNRWSWKLGKVEDLIVNRNQIVRENSPELTDKTHIRPKRTAAIVAKESFKVIDQFENEDME
eukprot:gene3879-15179_t